MYKDYIWENFMSREDSLLVNCLCIRIARNTICTLKDYFRLYTGQLFEPRLIC